ncbi:NAD-dependent deacylase [Yunchengibacter salinarum]|uniref:NAD-dependent deacylase n=1 Tax=Yunchengibacter salinarum TaxID=3133399 RepID=UPI0035B61024
MTPDHIVVLTGAGISAESGVATFRDSGGLWEKHAIEDVATPEGFARDPDLVHRFYNDRRAQLDQVDPNPAHQALARLQRAHPATVTVITQNVDDLHERGGVVEPIHMHGALREVRCIACDRVHDWTGPTGRDTICPSCKMAGTIRPNIVWFGEMPFQMDRIFDALRAADLFLSVGTSGTVYPAAGFVSEVARLGRAHSIEINMEPSDGASLFRECRHGPAGTLLPALVEELLDRAE